MPLLSGMISVCTVLEKELTLNDQESPQRTGNVPLKGIIWICR